jgi:DNA helicase INO80
VSDSGKLLVLDRLLRTLQQQGHRCLIFSQMTRMMDLLEEFFRFRRYRYFRLDGQTAVAERHDMVRAFQSDPRYFIFLLSTRAGALGINLTAADTVVFYDSDWNPTMDAQAMDRAHRIGQKKQVTVYRLVCKNTVEERILRRAQLKFAMQSTVYAGGFKLQPGVKSDLSQIFRPSELKDLMLEDDDAASATPQPRAAAAAEGSASLPRVRARRREAEGEGAGADAGADGRASKRVKLEDGAVSKGVAAAAEAPA